MFRIGCSTPTRTLIGRPTAATCRWERRAIGIRRAVRTKGEYKGLLVGASAALTGAETKSLIPFDLSAAVPPDKVDLRNITYERFVVPRKYARPLARQGLESLEAEACQQYVTRQLPQHESECADYRFGEPADAAAGLDHGVSISATRCFALSPTGNRASRPGRRRFRIAKSARRW